MAIPSELLEIGTSFEQKYQPVLDFEGWRVAMLRHCDDVDPEKFNQAERHNETNEVFILTVGTADLIICSGHDDPEDIYVINMVHNVAYNIPRSVWHHVLMSTDAHIILFERTNTGPDNSDYAKFTERQCEEIRSSACLCP